MADKNRDTNRSNDPTRVDPTETDRETMDFPNDRDLDRDQQSQPGRTPTDDDMDEDEDEDDLDESPDTGTDKRDRGMK